MLSSIISDVQSLITNQPSNIALLEKSSSFYSPEDKKELFSHYKDLYWKQLLWEIEIDKLTTKLGRKPTSDETAKLEMYQEAYNNIRNLESLDTTFRKLFNSLIQFFNNKNGKNRHSYSQKIFLKVEEEDMIGFLTELSQFYCSIITDSLSSFGLLKSTFSYLPFNIDDHKRILQFIQNYAATDWYKLYTKISELSEIYSTWYFNNYGNLGLQGINPIDWIKEYVKEPMQILASEHPEVKKEEKEVEMKSLLRLIKDLLMELSENDEVSMDLALKTIKEEKTIELISDDELVESVRKIVSDLPDFEYIRLKKVFRRKQNKSENLSTEIDKIINELLKSYTKI